MLLLLPLGLIAQEMKIAIVNTTEIFSLLPETDAVENELAKLGQQYQREAQLMDDEYARKVSDLTAQNDSLTDNIRKLRVQEIDDLRGRLENFIASAQENINKKQEELFAPLRDKVQKAIDSVGEENGYAYILNPQVLLYRGNSAIDATDKVKAKLGIK